MSTDFKYGCAITFVAAFFCGGVALAFLFALKVGIQ